MKFTTIAVLIAALTGFAASIYWSPYHSCVRALVDDGVSKADSSLYCARHLKVQ